MNSKEYIQTTAAVAGGDGFPSTFMVESMMSKTNTLVLTDEQYNAEFDPKLLEKKNDSSLTAEQVKIVSMATTKSDKIRQLLATGMKRGDVARTLNIKYQHVRNVELQPLKRK